MRAWYKSIQYSMILILQHSCLYYGVWFWKLTHDQTCFPSFWPSLLKCSLTLLSFLNTLYFCSTSSARVLTYLAPRHCCIISSLFSLSKDLFKCSSVVGRWIQAALWCFELAIQTSSFRKKTPYSIINSPQ